MKIVKKALSTYMYISSSNKEEVTELPELSNEAEILINEQD